MNHHSLVHMDAKGRVTIMSNLSSAPVARRGVRIEAGELYACPKCSRPMLMAGYALTDALTHGQAIGVPCRCGHEVKVSESGVVA